MGAFPKAFDDLVTGQEFLRARSMEAIEASDALKAHAELVKSAMDLIHHFIRGRVSEDQNVLTIQHLGIRLFNSIAVALNSAMTGYYQASAGQQRDLLETTFLLDLFSRDRSLIEQWRTLDSKARWAKFRPAKVRTELDELDGFTSRKRASAYELLSDLAGHPSVVGFQMLQAGEHGAHCGPFFELTAMDAVVSELAKLAFQAASTFTVFFDATSASDSTVKIDFLEVRGRWLERFFETPFDQTQIDEMRAVLNNKGSGDQV